MTTCVDCIDCKLVKIDRDIDVVISLHERDIMAYAYKYATYHDEMYLYLGLGFVYALNKLLLFCREKTDNKKIFIENVSLFLNGYGFIDD